jgi:hypothetical protein
MAGPSLSEKIIQILVISPPFFNMFEIAHNQQLILPKDAATSVITGSA